MGGGSPSAPGIGEDVSSLMTPTFSTSNERDASGRPVVRSAPSRFVGDFIQNVNPVPALKAANKSVSTAIQWVLAGEPMKGLEFIASDVSGVLGGIGAEQQRVYDEARQALADGDYVTGTRKALDYLVPLLGPAIDREADKAASGDIAGAMGGTLGLGAATVGPAKLAESVPVRVRPVLKNPNTAEADAAAFGLREGIPVDAGTASGNRFLRGTQRLAGESIGGSGIAERAGQARSQGLATLGEQLAAKTGRSATTSEQAGQSIRGALDARVTGLNDDATAAYGRLRAMEEAARPETRSVQPGAPVQSVRFPVNVKASKAQLQPIYEQLLRERELTGVLQGGKGRALVALDTLMNGPDYAPLSVVDAALGDIKALARGADIPALRTQGQGIAAEAVKALDSQVRATAAKAGPDVLKALEEGRKATTQKYRVADIRERLLGGTGDEPAKLTNRLLAGQDTAIDKLRELKSVAPDELAGVGRSFLDGLLQKATEAQGFDHAAKLYADWQRMGPETKRLLFKDPAYVHDLDRFFLLAKKLAENPNPSGTALTMYKGGELSLLAANPALGVPVSIGATVLTKMLHSPAVVKALTRTMTLELGGKSAAATTAAATLLRTMREAGIQTAEADREAPATSGGRPPSRR